MILLGASLSAVGRVVVVGQLRCDSSFRHDAHISPYSRCCSREALVQSDKASCIMVAVQCLLRFWAYWTHTRQEIKVVLGNAAYLTENTALVTLQAAIVCRMIV